jgi:hypothetical protein
VASFNGAVITTMWCLLTSPGSLLAAWTSPRAVLATSVGHRGTAVTEHVYRKQIRPVIETGAVKMDSLFPQTHPDKEAQATA